jgi:hypothetical protein
LKPGGYNRLEIELHLILVRTSAEVRLAK